MSMIDIHTHILPGMDDGSESMEDSLEMVGLAEESGVHTIVATPHSNMGRIFENFYSEEWESRFLDFEKAMQKAGSNIRLLRGMEIFGTGDVASKIQEGRLIPINDSRYYLIEFPFGADPFWIGDILNSVKKLGKVPVIAHPERYYCVQDNPVVLYEWMRQGCFSQVNKSSMFGRFGRQSQIAADILLRNRLATCVASDAHGPYQRTTYMGDIKDYLEDEYGEVYAALLLKENPERMIEDRDISCEGMKKPSPIFDDDLDYNEPGGRQSKV